ncbi:MAG TPA: cytidylate kinase-like family protein [Candidatus Acidoferrales bacterium]|nr:cytidylate kinase-like family protein [Candidatus Acidoferrales bacterium]
MSALAIHAATSRPLFRSITISREYGSGGAEIAKRLADRLGWKLVDDCLLGEIARQANVDPETARRYDERPNPWFDRLVKAIWHGGYEGAATRIEASACDADHIAQLWTRLIHQSAEAGGAVIVGRGGQCILRDRRDAFHVLVQAPFEVRIENLRRLLGLAAGLEILTRDTDRRRAAYLRRYFDEDWKNPQLYHLIVNSTIGLDCAVEAVLTAAALAGPCS